MDAFHEKLKLQLSGAVDREKEALQELQGASQAYYTAKRGLYVTNGVIEYMAAAGYTGHWYDIAENDPKLLGNGILEQEDVDALYKLQMGYASAWHKAREGLERHFNAKGEPDTYLRTLDDLIHHRLAAITLGTTIPTAVAHIGKIPTIESERLMLTHYIGFEQDSNEGAIKCAAHFSPELQPAELAVVKTFMQTQFAESGVIPGSIDIKDNANPVDGSTKIIFAFGHDDNVVESVFENIDTRFGHGKPETPGATQATRPKLDGAKNG